MDKSTEIKEMLCMYNSGNSLIPRDEKSASSQVLFVN